MTVALCAAGLPPPALGFAHQERAFALARGLVCRRMPWPPTLRFPA